MGGWEASFWGAERSDGASVVQCPVNALNAPDALLLKWFLLRQVEFTSIKKLLKMLTSPRSLGRAGLNAEVRGRAGGRCLCRLGRWLVCWREPRRAPSAAGARPPRSCRPLPATPQPAASLLHLPHALVQTCPLRSGRRSLPAATGLPGAERGWDRGTWPLSESRRGGRRPCVLQLPSRSTGSACVWPFTLERRRSTYLWFLEYCLSCLASVLNFHFSLRWFCSRTFVIL